MFSSLEQPSTSCNPGLWNLTTWGSQYLVRVEMGLHVVGLNQLPSMTRIIKTPISWRPRDQHWVGPSRQAEGCFWKALVTVSEGLSKSVTAETSPLPSPDSSSSYHVYGRIPYVWYTVRTQEDSKCHKGTRKISEFILKGGCFKGDGRLLSERGRLSTLV